jgi:hypothetical protein
MACVKEISSGAGEMKIHQLKYLLAAKKESEKHRREMAAKWRRRRNIEENITWRRKAISGVNVGGRRRSGSVAHRERNENQLAKMAYRRNGVSGEKRIGGENGGIEKYRKQHMAMKKCGVSKQR